METDLRQSWQCALWCGVAGRLIRERLAKEPKLEERQAAAIRSSIAEASRGVSYLSEVALEALGLLKEAA